jgi:hypothetical protein
MNRALAIKSETDTTLTLEGWGVVFGGEDLTAEYFSDKTDFWLEQLGPVKMTLFDHGQDDAIKSTVLGSGALERKVADDGTEGLWFTAQLDKSLSYVKQVAKLAKAGVLGASSGAVSHLIERVQEGEKTWIKSWPIAEVSLTVTPCEPRTLGFETLKALIAQGESAKAALAAAPRKAAADATKDASFEQIRDQIWAAVNRSENSPFEPYDADYSCVVATYPDFVIVERVDVDADGDGGLWRIGYSVDAAGQVTLGEAAQVQVDYTPITKSLVEHAEALKALLPKETPAKGVSQGSKRHAADQAHHARDHRLGANLRSLPCLSVQKSTTALSDGVAAKFAPQFDAISKILERFDNEPALKSAGHVSPDGGAADKNVKTFADWLVAVKRDTKRLETVYGSTKAALAEDRRHDRRLPGPDRVPRRSCCRSRPSRRRPLPRHHPADGRREMEVPALDQQTAQTAGTSAFFGGAQAYWTAEAGAYTETEPKFKMVRLVAHKLAGYTLSSNEMLADSAVALEALLRTLFGGRIAWYEDYAFLRGDGAGKPLGIQPAACTIAVNRAGANAIALADAGNMLAKLLPASYNNAVWVAHQSAIPQLIALSLSNATMVSWVQNLAGQKLPASLLGLPLIFSEKVPALGTKGDLGLYDFSKYLVGDRQDLTIASSEHYKFVNGQMTWKFEKRIDGQPWMKSAITLADATSTVSPFVILN